MTATREHLTLAVDAAMVEMQNISPPLRRSECERLIRAALCAQSAEPVQGEAALGSEQVLEIFERHGFRIELGASFSARGQIAQLLNAVGEIERRAGAVQGEAAAWLDLNKLAKTSMAYATSMRCTGLQSPVYTSPAKPDAELVELLSSCRGIVAREVERWNQVAARLLDKGAVESDLLKRIDAKLADLQSAPPQA